MEIYLFKLFLLISQSKIIIFKNDVLYFKVAIYTNKNVIFCYLKEKKLFVGRGRKAYFDARGPRYDSQLNRKNIINTCR